MGKYLKLFYYIPSFSSESSLSSPGLSVFSIPASCIAS
jgi:hypothetical protein